MGYVNLLSASSKALNVIFFTNFFSHTLSHIITGTSLMEEEENEEEERKEEEEVREEGEEEEKQRTKTVKTHSLPVIMANNGR